MNAPMVWGLLAALLPVIIHILNRRRPRIVPYAAMEFLRRVFERNRKRLELRERLLMALRILGLLAAAMFLMRPASAELALARGNRLRVLVIDTSASMGARSAGESAFDKALAGARRTAKAPSRPGDGTVVYTLGRKLERRGEGIDTASALRALDAVETTDEAGVSGALADLMGVLPKGTWERTEIFLFTDRQKSARWTAIPALGDDDAFHVHDVSLDKGRNVAVTSLELDAPIAVKGRRLSLSAELMNHSLVPEKVSVALYDEGSLVSTQGPLTLEPGVSQRLEFPHVFPEAGPRRIRVVVESDDVLSSDNHVCAGIGVSGKAGILLVDGDPGGVSFRDETFILRNLLAVPGLFDIDVVRLGRDDPMLADLSSKRLVVLADCPPLPAGFVDRLRAFVAEGGALWVGAGSNLELLGSPVPADLLCAKPGVMVSGDAPLVPVLDPGQHPETAILAKFNSLNLGEVTRLVLLEPESGSRVPMRAGEHPLLVVKDKLAFWASSLSFDWMRLAESDAVNTFGALSQELLRTLTLSRGIAGEPQTFDVRSSDAAGSPVFSYSEIGGQAVGLQTRAEVPMVEKGASATLTLPEGAAVHAGMVRLEGGQGALLGYTGINVDSREGDLVPDNDWPKPEARVSVTHNLEALDDRLRAEYPGRELWRLFAWLMLIALVAEIFVGRWGVVK
ncbi:MAG: BatA domain-containing protein [Planctomycetota bacterium]